MTCVDLEDVESVEIEESEGATERDFLGDTGGVSSSEVARYLLGLSPT